MSNLVITTPEAIKEVVSYFVMTKYIPSVQEELSRFLIEYYHKQRMLDDISQIVGYPVSGEVGVFHIQKQTEALIENIVKAFDNSLTAEEKEKMKATIMSRINSQNNGGNKK